MALDSLSTLYTSESRMPIQTLRIKTDNYGFDYCFVLGFEGVYCVDSNGQNYARYYQPSAFTVQMPNRSDAPTNQLTFGIGGVNMDIFTQLKICCGEKTQVIYREYNPDSRGTYSTYSTYNEIVTELKLDLQGIIFSNDSAQFQASFNDTLNLAFPRLRYTQHNAPGLQYVS